jgi:hypothetical protein
MRSFYPKRIFPDRDFECTYGAAFRPGGIGQNWRGSSMFGEGALLSSMGVALKIICESCPTR